MSLENIIGRRTRFGGKILSNQAILEEKMAATVRGNDASLSAPVSELGQFAEAYLPGRNPFAPFGNPDIHTWLPDNPSIRHLRDLRTLISLIGPSHLPVAFASSYAAVGLACESTRATALLHEPPGVKIMGIAGTPSAVQVTLFAPDPEGGARAFRTYAEILRSQKEFSLRPGSLDLTVYPLQASKMFAENPLTPASIHLAERVGYLKPLRGEREIRIWVRRLQDSVRSSEPAIQREFRLRIEDAFTLAQAAFAVANGSEEEVILQPRYTPQTLAFDHHNTEMHGNGALKLTL